jgi:hypothetical protein
MLPPLAVGEFTENSRVENGAAAAPVPPEVDRADRVKQAKAMSYRSPAAGISRSGEQSRRRLPAKG